MMNTRIGFGFDVQCSKCSQEWFQHNIENSKNKNINKESKVKQLAYDEYLFSIKDKNNESRNQSADKPHKGFENRLHKSSARLEETKRAIHEGERSTNRQKNPIDYSTILGFLLVSFLSMCLTVLYVSNQKFQQILPNWAFYLKNYKNWVDLLIQSIEDFTLTIISLFT